MATKANVDNRKVTFGVRKGGKAKKSYNKHDKKGRKKYVGQGRSR